MVKGGHLYVVHVGDCHAVLSRNGATSVLTADHTCARDEERERIEREGGGYVSHRGGCRAASWCRLRSATAR